jgi:hypothetical protein
MKEWLEMNIDSYCRLLDMHLETYKKLGVESRIGDLVSTRYTSKIEAFEHVLDKLNSEVITYD